MVAGLGSRGSLRRAARGQFRRASGAPRAGQRAVDRHRRGLCLEPAPAHRRSPAALPPARAFRARRRRPDPVLERHQRAAEGHGAGLLRVARHLPGEARQRPAGARLVGLRPYRRAEHVVRRPRGRGPARGPRLDRSRRGRRRHRAAPCRGAAGLAHLPQPAARRRRRFDPRPLFAPGDHLWHRADAGEPAGPSAISLPPGSLHPDLRHERDRHHPDREPRGGIHLPAV